ncbi:frequency clock protein [Annulohypoxylon maeteangense]|uniref:frequency clock protein n=1 Tax=Annulohypoxylon maeteangense TaxID=1927788 RepID=UPI002007474F|nr:frequency clock protein [Annulohypoxylon maeteangense]KAI0886733.1 frequency clock protein [Annulohypoxylon maeteangense]
MSDPNNAPAASRPPTTTYKNPRRTSAETSITLQAHRLARVTNASPPVPHSTPRRNSSGDSNETRHSAKNWFEASNKNAMANMDTRAMDLDPPFYQKATDDSNEEAAHYGVSLHSPVYEFIQSRLPDFRTGVDSSNEEFRSVIDDLTVENKRLKEELRKYKQMGPDSLRREKLFEVKVHGLSSRKKRELEAALRDFTTGLEDSSTGVSPGRKKTSSMSKNNHSSLSKHASSSSGTGSNSKPVDSAYASMSTGPRSAIPSLLGQATATRQRNEQKIENYLRDIPEGLWPRPIIMTEKEKKKLVVKRLEHLFTGKMGDPAEHVQLSLVPELIIEDVQMEGADDKVVPPVPSTTTDTTREAKIRPRQLRRKESSSRDNGSSSNSHSHSNSHSNGDQTEPRDNGNGSGSGSGHASGAGRGNNTSPHMAMPPSEQRPTRPRDLDPDRRQVPSENMDYIRHLGLVAPESQEQFSARDASPDAEGWVYLNLLCNLAQLHILNVTPAFIRNAVSEKSTKFQLSPDGRKIRWRGGDEGTKFNNCESTSNSQPDQSSDDTDGSKDQDQKKKQRTQASGNDVTARKPSKFGLGVQDSNSSESFHYKPLFVHQQTSSSDEQPSGGDETGSSYGPPEESHLGMHSRWGQSGVSGVSQRKRRRDGAIIYYSGAPFCTDLSGDFGDGEVSPATYDMTSSGDRGGQSNSQGPVSLGISRPQFSRSTSGSSLPFRPLSALPSSRDTPMDLDGSDLPDLTAGETDDDIDADFPWSEFSQRTSLVNLEASGLGGISPEDHFVVVVATRRPKRARCDENSVSDNDDEDEIPTKRLRNVEHLSQEMVDSKVTTESIINKLATMTTSSPLPCHSMADTIAHAVQIEYLNDRIRHLSPVPLPPPAFYFPAGDSDLDDDDESGDDTSSESLMSRRAIVEDDPGSDVDLSGNDEEDEHSDGGQAYDASGSISPNIMEELLDVSEFQRGRSGKISEISKMTTGSSAATAGGAPSGYNSSMEEDT